MDRHFFRLFQHLRGEVYSSDIIPTFCESHRKETGSRSNVQNPTVLRYRDFLFNDIHPAVRVLLIDIVGKRGRTPSPVFPDIL